MTDILEHLDAYSECDEFDVSSFRVKTRVYTKEELRQKRIQERRIAIRNLLLRDRNDRANGYIDIVSMGPEEVLERFGAQDRDKLQPWERLFGSVAAVDEPGLYGLLLDTSSDERGTETPVDAFGRTALMATVDPMFFNKLNASELGILHGMENLADLVYAGCSWETPDKYGRKPIEVCPGWLKDVMENINNHRNQNNGHEEN